MINFGVREVANSKTSAPGWAYVPVNNTGSGAASQPISRKRRTELSSNQHETTAKQDAKIARELAALDKENHREVSIPIPARNRDGVDRGKHLPTRILQMCAKMYCKQRATAK
jgi:zinc finger HIT domain-containing protein 1